MSRALALVVCGLTACDASLDQRLAIVREPRVIAVIAEPAEAKPGAQVTYTAVVASPDGPLAGSPSWAFCTAPKPPTQDNAVSDDCLTDDALIDLGAAPSVTAALPAAGCLLFGPDTAPGGFRPRDADPTGGYYQPVRAVLDELVAFGLSRITCKLPTAPPLVAHDYDVRYTANTNPTLDPLVLDAVPADRDVTLTASWPADAVESFLYYDPVAQALVIRREAMRVSWFATGGALAVDASAVAEDREETRVTTTWHTPAAGPAWLWLVLRDSRGGIATQTRSITVE